MRKKNNIYDFIKDFYKMLSDRIDSKAGRVNIGLGLLILLIITMVLFQPIYTYFLQFLQSLFNTFLLYHSKNTIQIEENPDTVLTLIICLIFLLFETIFCSLLVHWSESQKAETSNEQDENLSKIKKMIRF